MSGSGSIELRPLRWLPLWRGIGWSMVLGIIGLSLMPQPPAAPGGDKLHHFLAYFSLMLFFAQWHRRERLWKIALIFLAIGCGIELLQPMTGRYFSYLDMLANASGVLLAWLLAYSPLGTVLERIEHGLGL